MIPLQVTLKNFLSYRNATLNFRGLHVACICGANGAGKSSLLEAIAWAVWGQGRATSEDDLIHLGTKEAQVDFIFSCHQQTYRIIRSRYRGQTSSLEFQIQTQRGFRSLTGRGVRATQHLIREHVRLDYDTFINSAYLKQGRADEFMLKRPSERKQILADLLKLDQYDQLAEHAKERSRQAKADVSVLERTIDELETQLQQREQIAAERSHLEDLLVQRRQQQEQDTHTLKQLQLAQQQRQTWQQDLALVQQQRQHLLQEQERMHHDLTDLGQQHRRLDAILTESEAIATGYHQLQTLQLEDERQTERFQADQTAQANLQTRKQQLAGLINDHNDQIRDVQSRLDALNRDEDEVVSLLQKVGDLEPALEQLYQSRQCLSDLDQLQTQASPLIQRQQQIQNRLHLEYARLTARLDELQSSAEQLYAQQQRQPQLQQAVLDVAHQIEYLEQRRLYQQHVREKGTERRHFLERLQDRQRDYERQIAEWDAKIRMLQAEHSSNGANSNSNGYAIHDRDNGAQDVQARFSPIHPDVEDRDAYSIERDGVFVSTHSPPENDSVSYPPCPLCDRPLDRHHWQLVLERHQAEQQDLLRQLWVVREQLAVSEREIQILRQEYRELDQELTQYGSVLERRGQLQEQIQGAVDVQQRLRQIAEEHALIQRSLQSGSYAPELQAELDGLTQSLQRLNYDDKTHALVRGDVERWRWAEIKQAEVKQAQRRYSRIHEQRPQLEAQLSSLNQQLQAVYDSSLQHEIHRLEAYLADLGYDANYHSDLRAALRQAQSWQFRYQELRQAQQQIPMLRQRACDLEQALTELGQTLAAVDEQIARLQSELEQTPDCQDAIQQLEHQIKQRRSQLDEQLAHLGRLQQQQQHQDNLRQQLNDHQHRLDQARQQGRVYYELAQAFGKNGIQALMIENVLPQLEAEANQILGRLSANQLHVQFVTQRAGRRKSSRLIDTLDILIADIQGTRPYETYSGGEAFRVNFAIRLALARLLAQRSGTSLQMLIIDEGFGTQDAAGCDRLISAINAIASDFACILTVTHMPHLKEAFQTRIEVQKTPDGSTLHLLM
ncbi:MAG: AAA family ATPase [Elainellaceae cyanobacterium]